MKPKKPFVSIAVILLLPVLLFSQDISNIKFALLNSKCRRIDKQCKTLPADMQKNIIEGVGIGNTIFADSPLEIETNKTSIVPADKFDYEQITKGFYALAYFPGRKQNIVDFILAKYTEYNFEGVLVVLKWQVLNSDEKKTATAMFQYDFSGMWNDQEEIKIMPKSTSSGFSEVNLLDIPESGSLLNFIELFVYLRFTIGQIQMDVKGVSAGLDITLSDDSKGEARIEKTIHKSGDSTITEQQYCRDFLFSYGKCTVNYKKK